MGQNSSCGGCVALCVLIPVTARYNRRGYAPGSLDTGAPSNCICPAWCLCLDRGVRGDSISHYRQQHLEKESELESEPHVMCCAMLQIEMVMLRPCGMSTRQP